MGKFQAKLTTVAAQLAAIESATDIGEMQMVHRRLPMTGTNGNTQSARTIKSVKVRQAWHEKKDRLVAEDAIPRLPILDEIKSSFGKES